MLDFFPEFSKNLGRLYCWHNSSCCRYCFQPLDYEYCLINFSVNVCISVMYVSIIESFLSVILYGDSVFESIPEDCFLYLVSKFIGPSSLHVNHLCHLVLFSRFCFFLELWQQWPSVLSMVSKIILLFSF